MQTRRIGGLRYFTKEELEATNPSRREGIDAVTEAKWRSTTSKLVKLTIKTLKLPDWVYETAMCYINRFFLTRSISKNDRHLVIGGAILLASKAQESPRPVQDVAYVLTQYKYNSTQKPQHGRDQITLEQFIEGIKMAEQAILFSMNFYLNVETHVSLARGLLEPLDLWAKTNPQAEEAEDNKLKLSLYAALMFFLNDSAMTMLSLQYPTCKIAPVALLMAAKRIAEARYAEKELPPSLQRVLALGSDASWLEAKGLGLEVVADIEEQIKELYNTGPLPSAAQQQRHQQAPFTQAQHAAAGAAAGQSATVLPESEPHQILQCTPCGAAQLHHYVKTGSQAAEVHASSANGRGQPLAQFAGTHSLGMPMLPNSGMQATGRHVRNGVSSGDRVGGDTAPHQPGSPAILVAVASTPQCCRQGQPSSSAAAVTIAGITAGDTPELPQKWSPRQKPQLNQHHHVVHGERVGYGDDCNGDDQQATSELHAAPEQHPEAELDACARNPGVVVAGASRACNGLEDSANENCSPDGLTTGNASGSGCGVADGQTEVCSRAETRFPPLQSQPTQPQHLLDISSFESSHLQPQPCTATLQHGKRSREGSVQDQVVGSVLDSVDLLEPASKARRINDSQLMLEMDLPLSQSQPTQPQPSVVVPGSASSPVHLQTSQRCTHSQESSMTDRPVGIAPDSLGLFTSTCKELCLDESQPVPVWHG